MLLGLALFLWVWLHSFQSRYVCIKMSNCLILTLYNDIMCKNISMYNWKRERKKRVYKTCDCESKKKERHLTWSCLKSHRALTMMGLLLFSSGFLGLSLTMFLDLLTRWWTCLLFSIIFSFSIWRIDLNNINRSNYRLRILKLQSEKTHKDSAVYWYYIIMLIWDYCQNSWDPFTSV